MQMTDLLKKAGFFKALGEPIRLKIVSYLLEKEQCVCICDLSKLLKRDQSVIFRHIQILKKEGIVSTRKEEKYLMCCIADKNKIKKYLEE